MIPQDDPSGDCHFNFDLLQNVVSSTMGFEHNLQR